MTTPLYFDYMATTPVDPRIITYLSQVMSDPMLIGNPSAHSHVFGWQARQAIEEARATVAVHCGAQPENIIWTSGATESINLALQGVAKHYRRQGNHIITWASEHMATLATCQHLEQQGMEVTYLQPKADGLIDVDAFKAAFKPTTILVSVCHVNNEIGVIQDLKTLANITHEQGALIHVDAAQTLGKTSFDFDAMDIDFASISGHKVYAPKGIGALLVRQRPKRRLEPLLYGGDQQPYRSGTLPLHLILSFAQACQLAAQHMHKELADIQVWYQQCCKALLACDGVQLTGHPTQRIPHNLHITIKDIHGESLLLALNQIAISSGSACNSVSPKPSHVLKALGLSRQQSLNALRISMGRFTTQQDIDVLCEHIPKTLQQLRQWAP